MLTFAWWWCAALLPVPYAVYRWWPCERCPDNPHVLAVPAALFSAVTAYTPSVQTSRVVRALLVAIWCACTVALMRPQWVGDATALPQSGRDLLLVLDLSESMLARDFVFSGQSVSRLGGTLRVADDFIAARTNDRIGLILFADHAYLQAPLTFDHKTVRTFLGEAQVGLAGKKTAIGEALALSVKKLTADTVQTEKVVVLLTDGENSAGVLTPLEAAALARDAGIRIYTISIGPEFIETGTFFFSRRISRSEYADEKTLQAVAEMTGGAHFFAGNAEELQNVSAMLDALEPNESDSTYYKPRTDYYFVPLTVAFFLLCVFVVVRNRL